MGVIGVDIFFVLSGFLITGLLLEEWDETGRISIKRFYARRALRLLPALVVVLASLLVFMLFTRPAAEVRSTGIQALVTLSYGMNWMRAFGAYVAALRGHTLAVSI